MTINRDNYEEFFLLYVDNELSAKEKNAVEKFVSENLDLREELLMLTQSILVADPINFAGKESLYREESIDGSLQQELLLLLDNELDSTATEKMVTLTDSNDAVKKEWELLLQTRLDKADNIIFSDKASLYKKESTPVIPIRWRNIAAAAVIIGAAVWSLQSYFDKSRPLPTVATATSNPAKSNSSPITQTSDQPSINMDSKTTAQAANASIESSIIGKKPASPAHQKTNQPTPTLLQKTLNGSSAIEVASSQGRPVNHLPALTVENNNRQESNIMSGSTVSPTELSNINMNSAISNSNVNEPTLVQETAAANQYAIQTADTEPENNLEEKGDNGVKSKLGGFFKKIKRVVERKTNMQSSDRSIKIANLSFAVK